MPSKKMIKHKNTNADVFPCGRAPKKLTEITGRVIVPFRRRVVLLFFPWATLGPVNGESQP